MGRQNPPTKLHFAAADGDLRRVVELLAAGYDVNRFDEIAFTPLHCAAKGDHCDVVAYLLQHGANVNAHDETQIGNTPLGEVAGNCSYAMAKLLIDAGANPRIPGWMQITALHTAAERKRGDGPRVHELLVNAAKRFRD